MGQAMGKRHVAIAKAFVFCFNSLYSTVFRTQADWQLFSSRKVKLNEATYPIPYTYIYASKSKVTQWINLPRNPSSEKFPSKNLARCNHSQVHFHCNMF